MEVPLSAERWLPLEEVRPENLARYLRARRQGGWTIVALEQASGSVPLHEYAAATELWRRTGRTLLLLGAEGTGLPPPLLAEVDTCIEIPQYGRLRSLNVHVSAAIAICELKRDREAVAVAEAVS